MLDKKINGLKSYSALADAYLYLVSNLGLNVLITKETNLVFIDVFV